MKKTLIYATLVCLAGIGSEGFAEDSRKPREAQERMNVGDPIPSFFELLFSAPFYTANKAIKDARENYSSKPEGNYLQSSDRRPTSIQPQLAPSYDSSLSSRREKRYFRRFNRRR